MDPPATAARTAPAPAPHPAGRAGRPGRADPARHSSWTGRRVGVGAGGRALPGHAAGDVAPPAGAAHLLASRLGALLHVAARVVETSSSRWSRPTPRTGPGCWIAPPDCGFDASQAPASEVPGMIRDNALTWRRLLGERAVRPGRPDGTSWSSLEYACHARDVYRRYKDRVGVMLARTTRCSRTGTRMRQPSRTATTSRTRPACGGDRGGGRSRGRAAGEGGSGWLGAAGPNAAMSRRSPSPRSPAT